MLGNCAQKRNNSGQLCAQVVCATCNGAGDERHLKNMRFRMVVLDEATQATEPSAIIPLVS